MFFLNLFSLAAFVFVTLHSDLMWRAGESNRLGEFAGIGLALVSVLLATREDKLRKEQPDRTPISYLALVGPVVPALVPLFSQVMWAGNTPNDLMFWGAVLAAAMLILNLIIRVATSRHRS